MDQPLSGLRDDLDMMRIFARLVCPDDRSAEALLERSLHQAIQRAGKGEIADHKVELLRLMCADPDLQLPKIFLFPAKQGEGLEALLVAIRSLPLPQRLALVLLDLLHLTATQAERVLEIESLVLVRHQVAAREALHGVLLK
ncbi:hypothetical protein [Paracoccus aestuariivivens]|uniref:Uncharacterized protein n=1 Tax=Paracoccus aestuariivivens TaxID=1820333 RepID=A0A6L6JEK3_9RHOB|nr:hypothetical protein [Paracoccus aestuariivivens]MTH79179.1 hypothetical protein [Paracoccus aestuariivivens]